MREETFAFADPTGLSVFAYRWSPEGEAAVPVRGAVQISHGMVEHAARYRRFAKKLTDSGFIVYANDHRGHGRTAGAPDNIGLIGQDGFHRMVDNLHQLNGLIREENPDRPVFLFGHSMGSFLAQRYACLYGEDIAGLILSGSNGDVGASIHAAILLAKLEMWARGPHRRSNLLQAITFGAYNREFRPTRTGFDWLNRDPGEVDRYLEDPFCGAVATSEFYYYLYCLLRDNYKSGLLEQLPKSLPILLLAGGSDPLSKGGKGVLKLYRMYLGLGLTEVSYKLYPGARHEILNETNREEVMDDIAFWLQSHIHHGSEYEKV